SRFAWQVPRYLKWVEIGAANARSPACANCGGHCPRDLSLSAQKQMPADIFFDTNVLIYAIAERDRRTIQAETLLLSGGVISLQGLNEFVSVARCKIGMPWEEIEEALDALVILCPSPIPVTLEIHQLALNLAPRYGFNFYDALVAAAA